MGQQYRQSSCSGGDRLQKPRTKPGEFVLTPVYDALGGHIVADSLLSAHKTDAQLEWLRDQEVIDSFLGDHSHQLSWDIFVSLVALVPGRIYGGQLWKTAPDPFRISALLSATGLEAKYLDKDTIDALSALLRESPKARRRLFELLKGLRAAPNHPLNSDFLDSALRGLSVSDRDLSWTEWIRGTRVERFNDIVAVELEWKINLISRTPSDRLRAKWVMWLLTSTDHELRDVATRALYWFGRGDPEALFEESLHSLGINDPYVPERMLAASYGVAMARHVDLKDNTFVTTTLPKYIRSLYESMFRQGAPFSTTHILFREYAFRTAELAMFHDTALLTQTGSLRCKPPFADGGLRIWGESGGDEDELRGPDSPFHMDFENYTLGTLVPDRGNYDFKHNGYRKTRSQVLWRVEQLGWKSELFKAVEDSISRGQHWSRTASDARKVDRYGKKYSWIAYFEMSGLLHDQGVLKNWRERSSRVDIDPSFPERVAKGRLIQADFLGDPHMEMEEWIRNGPSPDVNSYLRLAEVHNGLGPWVMLDGFFVQEDDRRGRRLFCFIRSFLVAKEEAEQIVDHLSRQYLGGRWLPEKPQVIYTFAGEIPWCETFPENGRTDLSFVVKEETIKVQRTQEESYLNGEKLGLSKIELILNKLRIDAGPGTEKREFLSDEDLERIEVREVPIEVEEISREYMKFSSLIPVCDFAWEGYQSTASDAGPAATLAREIASELELIGQPQTFDLFTGDGQRATLNISDHSKDFNNSQAEFFVREDLLKVYLQRHDLALIWATWGEREYSYARIEKFARRQQRPEQPYAVFSCIKQYE